MKFYILNLFLIIFLLKITNEEGNNTFGDLLIKGLTFISKLNFTNSTDSSEEKEKLPKVEEKYIYEMNSTEDFDLNIKINGTKDNTLIILFYSEYCVHCQNFLPVYREISEMLSNDTSLKFSKIQFSLCDKILKKYTQLKILGVPTVYVYSKGRFYRQEGSRTKDLIISFIYQIKNFDCNEITSLDELSLLINKKTIFKQDKEKQFILGIFPKNKNLEKNFVVDNFIELSTLNPDIILNKRCYYFFKEKKINLNDIDKGNFYLKHTLYKKSNEIGDYLIYSYNYQKGLNTFSLFSSYLFNINNLTKINDLNNANINTNKNIKIIRNKFKNFLDENYLYKYYLINDEREIYGFSQYEKKIFVFYHNNNELVKFYIDEINYILSLNHSLNCDYLFVLFNITNKFDRKKRLTFFNTEDFDNTILLMEDELNKTSVESTILEYISKDRKHELKNKMERAQKIIKDFKNWLFSLGGNKSQIDELLKTGDSEQELIDEINKTIIEDEKAQKYELEKQLNESDPKGINNLKIINDIIKRRQIIELMKNEELGFNKNLVLIPFFLIIYSLLFFLCYKYVLGKLENKIFYTRLPTEEQKYK